MLHNDPITTQTGQKMNWVKNFKENLHTKKKDSGLNNSFNKNNHTIDNVLNHIDKRRQLKARALSRKQPTGKIVNESQDLLQFQMVCKASEVDINAYDDLDLRFHNKKIAEKNSKRQQNQNSNLFTNMIHMDNKAEDNIKPKKEIKTGCNTQEAINVRIDFKSTNDKYITKPFDFNQQSFQIENDTFFNFNSQKLSSSLKSPFDRTQTEFNLQSFNDSIEVRKKHQEGFAMNFDRQPEPLHQHYNNNDDDTFSDDFLFGNIHGLHNVNKIGINSNFFSDFNNTSMSRGSTRKPQEDKGYISAADLLCFSPKF